MIAALTSQFHWYGLHARRYWRSYEIDLGPLLLLVDLDMSVLTPWHFSWEKLHHGFTAAVHFKVAALTLYC